MSRRLPSDSLRTEAAPEPIGLVPRTMQPPTIALLIAGSLCTLPFLLPYNQLFEAEWIAAALGVAAIVAAAATRSAAIMSLPRPARWLIAFALFLGAQSYLLHPIYPQVPTLAALYVLYAVLLVWLGAQLVAVNGIERAATLLAACLLVGALLNAAAGVIQVYNRPGLYGQTGLLTGLRRRAAHACRRVRQYRAAESLCELSGPGRMFAAVPVADTQLARQLCGPGRDPARLGLCIVRIARLAALRRLVRTARADSGQIPTWRRRAATQVCSLRAWPASSSPRMSLFPR